MARYMEFTTVSAVVVMDDETVRLPYVGNDPAQAANTACMWARIDGVHKSYVEVVDGNGKVRQLLAS